MSNTLNLAEIPQGIYDGYIWKSDSSKPEEYHQTELLNLDFTDQSNPFIVEGQLYCDTQQKSYSITYVDGKHLVVGFDLRQLGENFTAMNYIPNRISAQKLLFRTYWENKPDELCENMNVLIPTAVVFVGFKKKEDKK